MTFLIEIENYTKPKNYTLLRFKDLWKKLKEKNLYVNAVIQLPRGFFPPVQGMISTLVVITKINSKEALFAEFEDWHGNAFRQFEHIIDTIINYVLLEPLNRTIQYICDKQNPDGGFYYAYENNGHSNLSTSSYNFQALNGAVVERLKTAVY